MEKMVGTSMDERLGLCCCEIDLIIEVMINITTWHPFGTGFAWVNQFMKIPHMKFSRKILSRDNWDTIIFEEMFFLKVWKNVAWECLILDASQSNRSSGVWYFIIENSLK